MNTASGDTGRGRSFLPSSRPPWADSKFWLLQIVVLALALGRLAVTVSFHLDTSGLVVEVSTVALFVVPVVVAALNYGLAGGVVTVVWVVVVCIPRLVEAAGNRRWTALWAEVLQLAVLVALVVLVGRRVSAETRLADQADAARKARLRAELLYQDMFESNRSPILIVDADGYVVESNASADRVFGPPPGSRSGSVVGAGGSSSRRLVDVVGADAAALVLTRLVSDDDPDDSPDADADDRSAGPDGSGDPAVGGDDRVRPVAFESGGRRLLYRPTAALVGSPGADRRMQVIFEDVTAETRRHDLMEAYAGQVVLGQEEERRHIAQELHDGPLQTLIHLCRQIDALDATDRAADPSAPAGVDAAGTGRPTLASMRTTVEETVAELRSIARGLRPSVLDDLGLVASINQMLQDATRRQGFAGDFEVEGDVRRLPQAVELAVFRIAQEAVTNVERHAEAHRVTVRLRFSDAGLGLRVEDDGIGFDAGAPGPGDDGQSLGLPGMGERARLVGGRLTVRSHLGAGTTVEVLVPATALAGS